MLKRKDGSISFDFDLSDPAVQDFIQQRTFDFWDTTSQTTKDNLKRILQQARSEGWNTDQLSAGLQTGLFGELTAAEGFTRAQRIARTETTIALNQGSMLAYQQSGVVEKKSWLTAGDEVVRESHQMCEAQGPLAMDKAFQNGLMFPGDPGGDVAELVNCRCTLLPEVVENAAQVIAEEGSGSKPSIEIDLRANQKAALDFAARSEANASLTPLKTQIGKEMGATVSNQELDQLLAYIQKRNSVRMMFPASDREKLGFLLDDPYLKNQFQLDAEGKLVSSNGYHGPYIGSSRDGWDNNMADGALASDPRYRALKGKTNKLSLELAEERPVYGYSAYGSSRTFLMGQYGDVSFELAPELRAAATTTLQNSSTYGTNREFLEREFSTFTENRRGAIRMLKSISRNMHDYGALVLDDGSILSEYDYDRITRNIESGVSKLKKEELPKRVRNATVKDVYQAMLDGKDVSPSLFTNTAISSYMEAQIYRTGGVSLEKDVVAMHVSRARYNSISSYREGVDTLSSKYNIPIKWVEDSLWETGG